VVRRQVQCVTVPELAPAGNHSCHASATSPLCCLGASAQKPSACTNRCICIGPQPCNSNSNSSIAVEIYTVVDTSCVCALTALPTAVQHGTKSFYSSIWHADASQRASGRPASKIVRAIELVCQRAGVHAALCNNPVLVTRQATGMNRHRPIAQDAGGTRTSLISAFGGWLVCLKEPSSATSLMACQGRIVGCQHTPSRPSRHRQYDLYHWRSQEPRL